MADLASFCPVLYPELSAPSIEEKVVKSPHMLIWSLVILGLN